MNLQIGSLNVIADGGQRKTVERTGNGQRVGSHILEHKNIINLHVRHLNTFAHLIEIKPKDRNINTIPSTARAITPKWN